MVANHRHLHTPTALEYQWSHAAHEPAAICRSLAAEAKAREAAARAEDRERDREAKRAAAEEARRYPLEDLALLQELRDKAIDQGLLQLFSCVCARACVLCLS